MLLLLSLFPVKAYATDFDYTDYIVSDSYQDGMNTLQIRIPIEEFNDPSWGIYQLQNGSYKFVRRYYGRDLDTDMSKYVSDTSLPFMVDFFAFYDEDYLDLTDIPNGSTLRLEFDITDYNSYGYPDFNSYWVINYYDANQIKIDTVFTEPVITDFEANSVETVIQKPAGAVYFTCSVVFRGISLAYNFDQIDLRCHAFVFDLSIEAMQREQQISGKTNELLEAVNDSLNVTVPGAGDSINDSNDAQDRLEQAGDALQNVPKPPVSDIEISIDNYVDVNTTDSINGFLDVFWDSNFFLTMVLLVFTMGTCSYILFGKR